MLLKLKGRNEMLEVDNNSPKYKSMENQGVFGWILTFWTILSGQCGNC